MGENPFPDKPPKFIRASLYKYHFTSKDEKDETRLVSVEKCLIISVVVHEGA